MAGIEISSVEQRVIIDTGKLPPAGARPNPASPPAWQGRTQGQTGTGPLGQRPGKPLRPTQQPGPDEDKYAENLDLDPLFDDED